MSSNKTKIPKYNFKTIERKWRKKWEGEKSNQPDMNKAKKPFYNLMMFPYPSAEGLHVGNMYAFTGADVYGRFKKMQGYDVFEPIGLDGFGIHSENYAIKIGEHIKEVSKRSEKRFYNQLASIGNMYDWSRTVETYKPDYYRWTQWIFLQMFKKGLAYQKKAKVNWCPWCKTVLSDEQVIAGKCERCDSEVEKKELNQWFFGITKYADRLLKNLEWIDWPEDVKLNQKNWIGKSIGAEIKFPLQCSRINADKYKDYLEVFTTRPDTLFGATYMVVAPENELLKNQKSKIKNQKEVFGYINKALKKSEEERKTTEKEKTGIEVKGIKALNPATGEEIPIWVADYVLADYGTGAIMAVPAHDERDFEFAKKFGLEIKNVVAPYLMDQPRKDKKTYNRDVVAGIVKDPKSNKYLCLKWLKASWQSFPTGGTDGEDIIKAAKREIKEETGYTDLKYIDKIEDPIFAEFYRPHKDSNVIAKFKYVLFELKSEKRERVSQEEKDTHEVLWVKEKDIEDFINVGNQSIAWKRFHGKAGAFCDEGVNINSGFLDGLKTPEAKKEIIKWLEKNKFGKKSVDYKLRDWCVSRQRYWGPPIPIVHCEKCGTVPVPEEDLPVKLPPMDDFLPEGKGKGPLAKNEKFVKTKCPKCGGEAERETDVSDPFVDSSWYFFRYPSTESRDKIFDKKRTKKWLPVDSYIGGKEHTVLHLLYSRFVTMVFKDLGLIDFEEPYKRFFGHGLITKDGAKMSKSKGNVVNPDEMIEKYGADTMRLYLRFLGDFSQGGDWRDSGIEGMSKFVKKLWKTFFELENCNGKGVEKTGMIDKTIKSIGEDIDRLSFNTAVARLMEYINWLRENIDKLNKAQAKQARKTLALVLAPMAPHMAEEFWSELGYKKSIFQTKWPEYDKKNIIEDEIELVLQANGKIRDRVRVSKDISEKEAKKLAVESEKVKAYTKGKEIVKTIYVPGKLVNIVAR